MPHRTMTGRHAPTFLGIGPPKCGTTWLDAVLRRHPQVLMPSEQKEVFFFSRYHDRGRDWYQSLFAGAEGFRAAGEISTNYIKEEAFLARIAGFDPGLKIIILLRNPTNRLLSHYRMQRENARVSEGFEEVVAAKPHLVAYSSYAARLAEVQKHFPRTQVFPGIFEEVLASRESQVAFLEDLARFLDIDPAPMAGLLPDGKVRETLGLSRFPSLTRVVRRVRRRLRDADREWLVDGLARIGVTRQLFLARDEGSERPDPDLLRRLDAQFAPDRAAVEAFLGRPVPSWEVTR